MILEVAVLNVIPGQETAFEAAYHEAQAIIASMKGYQSHQLQPYLEKPNQYILLVHWDTLEDNMVGLHGSPEYQRWRALLHQFYDPFLTVEYYEWITGGRKFG